MHVLRLKTYIFQFYKFAFLPVDFWRKETRKSHIL
jgi:hypothetical protein